MIQSDISEIDHEELKYGQIFSYDGKIWIKVASNVIANGAISIDGAYALYFHSWDKGKTVNLYKDANVKIQLKSEQ